MMVQGRALETRLETGLIKEGFMSCMREAGKSVGFVSW